ncbi:MAG: PAS domain-containing protein [Gemmatimonadetes bacterium]|nr:PAS domain-containing protein [Gemmatimonadota bacterium]
MSPADFRAFAHLLPEACLLVGSGGEILGVNPAAERLTGRGRSELEGARLFDIVSDDEDDVRAYLSSASRTRGPVSGALTFSGDEDLACSCLGGLVEPGADGRSPSLLLRVKKRQSATNRFRLLDDQIGRLTEEVRRRLAAEQEQARLLARESEMRAELERRTTELQRATATLERSRALLEESQRSAHVGSWEWDLRTGAITWSDELYRIYGLDPDEETIDFERFRSMVHPQDRDRLERTIARATEDADFFAVEHRIVRPDGTVRVIQGRGRAVTGHDGSVERMIGSGQDITERKRIEERARFLADAGHVLTSSLDYAETLRRVADLTVPRIADWAAVDVLVDGEIHRLAIVHPDPEKRALAEEAARRWPTDPDERHGIAHVQRTGEPVLIADVPETLLEESAKSAEHLRILRALGLRSAMIVPMAARGQILGSIAFIAAESGRRFGEGDLAFAHELADRAALAVDNARLYKEAQEASRARDDMIAIVSHDLRSPLNAVLAGASLLLEIPLPDDKRQEQHEAIKRSAQRMESLTRDLLDITRIEAGHLRVEPKAEDARSLVDEALEAAGFAAAREGIALSCEVPGDLPRVKADRARILQVLDNLLSNSIRHTGEGGSVIVRVEACDGDVRFQVTDTGVGVPPELADHIFDRYWQAQRSDHGGAGLGLPIARGIVEAHRGRIWLESTSGSGTTFVFSLPNASRPLPKENDSVLA